MLTDAYLWRPLHRGREVMGVASDPPQITSAGAEAGAARRSDGGLSGNDASGGSTGAGGSGADEK